MTKPSASTFQTPRIEHGTVVDVNKETHAIYVTSSFVDRGVSEAEPLLPYHHYKNGEGFQFLPEVGSKVLLLRKSDGGGLLILGYVGVPGLLQSEDGEPIRSGSEPGGYTADLTHRSNRPDMDPGDIGFTARDGNYLWLRRGGVVQIGSTALAQTVYIPVKNFIKQYAENYEMHHVGGELSWLTARAEDDPSGQASCSYTFTLGEYAQDEKATVMVRHLAPKDPGSPSEPRSAWEVVVAPQGINRDDKSYTGEVYRLQVNLQGDRVESMSGSYELRVGGGMTFEADGDVSHRAGGSFSIQSDSEVRLQARTNLLLRGQKIQLGAGTARMVLGEPLVRLLQLPLVVSTGGTASLSPAALAMLESILSTLSYTE